MEFLLNVEFLLDVEFLLCAIWVAVCFGAAMISFSQTEASTDFLGNWFWITAMTIMLIVTTGLLAWGLHAALKWIGS